VTDPNLISLAWGPESKAITWHKYFINGYKFHTEAWAQGKKTINSGVYVNGFTGGGEDDFYGVIQHIFELQYHKFPYKIALFYCRLFDPRQNRGTKVHPHYDIVDIRVGESVGLSIYRAQNLNPTRPTVGNPRPKSAQKRFRLTRFRFIRIGRITGWSQSVYS
jgi:hypothetical protein